MNIIDLATKTLQLAIQTAVAGVKTVVDAIKTTTDTTKSKVDTIDTRTNTINSNVSAINTNVAAVKTVVDSTKSVVDATKVIVDNTKNDLDTLLAGRVVKSVQRGRFNTPDAAQYTIILSTVNPGKCHVEFYGTSSSDQFPHVHSLSENQLIIQAGPNPNHKFNINTYYMSWEIIEFY